MRSKYNEQIGPVNLAVTQTPTDDLQQVSSSQHHQSRQSQSPTNADLNCPVTNASSTTINSLYGPSKLTFCTQDSSGTSAYPSINYSSSMYGRPSPLYG